MAEIILDANALEAAKACLGDALAWGAEPKDALESAIVEYFSAAALARAEANAGGPVECERCQGNGEIVTDWDRYKHPHDGDVGDEAVTPCPDCYGCGYTHPAPQPSGPVGALADALRGLLKAYENAFDWTAELPPETAEAERIANEVLEALTSSKPEQVPSEDMICAAQAQISEGIGAYLRKFADSIEAKRARDYLHKMPESEWVGMTRLLAEESVSAALRAAPTAGGGNAE